MMIIAVAQLYPQTVDINWHMHVDDEAQWQTSLGTSFIDFMYK